jgi:hypothetical protein
MGSQFDMLYGDRYGLHITDVTGFYNDWCVLRHSKPPECTKLKNQAEYGSTLSLREFDVHGGQRQQFLI